MIILLNTSTPLCRLGVESNDSIVWHEWQADRTLARGLLNYIITTLKKNNETLDSITGIGIFKGPGSFTGLRIGIIVMNTLADGLEIPIVGSSSDEWVDEVVKRLKVGDNERIVMPYYGADANITKPRK